MSKKRIGDNNPKSKLTADDVLNIRYDYEINNIEMGTLAIKYGVKNHAFGK